VPSAVPGAADASVAQVLARLRRCPDAQATAVATPSVPPTTEISLAVQYGTYALPVSVDGGAPRLFTIDTGASGVSIPQDLADELRAKGALTDADAREWITSILGDGRTRPEPVYLLRSVAIPGVVVHDVLCSVAPAGSQPLLGNAFLSRFHSVTIDTDRRVLVLR
jgi:predicted aspartyl protease